MAAPSVMPDGPAVRVGSDDRTAAILPAPARAGLRMDCQGSSDEIVQRGLPCRRSGNWRANRRLPLERMRISPAGLVRPRRAGRRNRARNAEAHRDRRRRSATGARPSRLRARRDAAPSSSHDGVRCLRAARDICFDHPAGRLEVAVPDAPAQHVAGDDADVDQACLRSAHDVGAHPFLHVDRHVRMIDETAAPHRRPRPVVAAGICVPSCVGCDARHRASRPDAARVAEAVVQRR